MTLRDPSHPRWPRQGATTDDEPTARLWSWRYVEHLQREAAREARGPSVLLLRDAIDAYMEHRTRSRSVAANTLRSDATALNRMAEEIGRRVPVVGIRQGDLQRFVNLLAEDYQASTIRTYITSLHGFFAWAQVEENPTTGLDLPTVEDADARAWEEEEIQILREAADRLDEAGSDFPYRRSVELGLGTGARMRELAALRWEQIDPVRCTVRLTHQMSAERTPAPLKGKTNRTTLVLPEWWPHHQQGATGLMLTYQGRPLAVSQQGARMRELLGEAKLKDEGLGWHTLRHTYARRFIEMGGRFEELQKSLGHTSIATTERVYGHFHSDRAAEAARGRIYADTQPLRLVR